MKFLLPCVSFFVFAGCAHFKTIQMVSFDKEAATVTFQGDKWNTKEDFQTEADNYCGKKATVIKMNQINEGSRTTIDNSPTQGTTSAKTVPIIKYNYTFKCN